MAVMQISTITDLHIVALTRQDGHGGVERQQIAHRRLEVGCRKDRRHQGTHPCICREGLDQSILAQIADIQIIGRLAPGPAMGAIINRECFTEEKFTILRRILARAHAQGGAAHADRKFFAIGKARCIHRAFQMRRRQIGPCRGNPLIGHSVPSAAHRSRARHWPRRRWDGPVWRGRSRREYPDAPSFWSWRQSGPETARR